MIDPQNITNFSRTESELQEYLMFCLAVAGKKASMIANKLNLFLSGALLDEEPFAYILRLHAESRLDVELRKVGMGKYDLLGKAYPMIAHQFRGRLAHVPISELESIRGIGPKTARYFVLHSRSDAGEIAVIDTHVMKYLRQIGHKVPNRLPTRSNYGRLERLMVDAALASGMTMADFDLAVWNHYSSGGARPLPVAQHQESLAA